MKVILGTYSSLDDYSADCDCALVDLTPVLAARILRQMDLADGLHKADDTLHEMCYWDSETEFFMPPSDPEFEKWLPEDCESVVVLPDNVTIPAECFQSTEDDRRVINVVGSHVDVHWRCSPKNVAITITTASLPRPLVEQAARRPEPPLGNA